MNFQINLVCFPLFGWIIHPLHFWHAYSTKMKFGRISSKFTHASLNFRLSQCNSRGKTLGRVWEILTKNIQKSTDGLFFWWKVLLELPTVSKTPKIWITSAVFCFKHFCYYNYCCSNNFWFSIFCSNNFCYSNFCSNNFCYSKYWSNNFSCFNFHFRKNAQSEHNYRTENSTRTDWIFWITRNLNILNHLVRNYSNLQNYLLTGNIK